MKFYCIADEDTVLGFRLAGISGVVVTTATEAADAIQHALGKNDCGIIIITDRIANGIRAEVDRVRFERHQPLIVEIAGSGGPAPGRKSLLQLVREAVGMHIGPEEGG